MRNEREANVLLGQRTDPAEPWMRAAAVRPTEEPASRSDTRQFVAVVVARLCLLAAALVLVAKGCGS